jgi:predicted lipoprotein with Yx(FWY)xxD motif
MHHGTASAGTGVVRRSRPRVAVLVALGAAAIALAACGGSSSSSSSKKTTTTKSGTAAAAAVVKTASSGMLGTIVVTNDGKTVYTLTNAGQQVPCTGACLQNWLPVMATGGKATGAGVQNVGTTSSGQVTINGAPVYTFIGDSKAGDTNGEGIMSFGGMWNVVKAGGSSGGAGTGATTPATTAKSSSSGY